MALNWVLPSEVLLIYLVYSSSAMGYHSSLKNYSKDKGGPVGKELGTIVLVRLASLGSPQKHGSDHILDDQRAIRQRYNAEKDENVALAKHQPERVWTSVFALVSSPSMYFKPRSLNAFESL